MPIIVVCPTCGGQLRVADVLLGQKVRCPACNGTFDAAAPDAPPAPDPLPPFFGSGYREVPLEREGPAPPDAPPLPLKPSGGPRGLKGAVEVNMSPEGERAPRRAASLPSRPEEQGPAPARPAPRLGDAHDDLKTCPRCGKHVHRDSRTCYSCGARFDEDHVEVPSPSFHRSGEPLRRDTHPHRGGTLLTMGIVGLVLALIPCPLVFPFGLGLGVAAWLMASGDLRAIRANEMDAEGQSMTRASWVLGIIGTVAGTLMLLTCFTLLGISVHSSYQNAPNTRPIGAPAEGGPQ